MSLSDRFEKLPAPKYESMTIKPKLTNGILIARPNPNKSIMYDEAIIAAEPQIIRPNVSNFSMNDPHKKKANQTIPNNKNRFEKQKSNAGRGALRINNHFKTNGFQTQQNGGYKSYRTTNIQQRNAMNHTPYKRPHQKPPKPRQLPTYHTNTVYNRGKNNEIMNQKRNEHQNGYNNRNNEQFNNKQYLYDKRQNYYNQRNNVNNNRNNSNLRRNNRFNNKNKLNNSRRNDGNKNGNAFKQKTDAALLDRELDAYNMKNPNAEDRNNTISANLDKELDDYFNHSDDNNNNHSNAGNKE